MRLFIAIELTPPVREHVSGIAARARSTEIGPCSWVRTDNLHVTVKFLGEVPEPQIPEVCAALGKVMAGGPIVLRSSHLECFPPRGPVRVIAAGLSGEIERLRDAHAQIETACAQIGIPAEGRRFVPHITLARARRGLPARARNELESITRDDFPGAEMAAGKFVLMESRLKPTGAEYLPLARFRF